MTHPRISAAEADRLMREEGYAYIDVRSVPEYDAGHPRGAYNIPFAQPEGGTMKDNPAFVPVVAAVFPRDAPLVLGCRSGRRSDRAARALVGAGFARVVEQRAGWDGVRDAFGRAEEPGWSAAGLEAATRSEPGRDYATLRAKLG